MKSRMKNQAMQIPAFWIFPQEYINANSVLNAGEVDDYSVRPHNSQSLEILVSHDLPETPFGSRV
jgi:hypothetical protein